MNTQKLIDSLTNEDVAANMGDIEELIGLLDSMADAEEITLNVFDIRGVIDLLMYQTRKLNALEAV